MCSPPMRSKSKKAERGQQGWGRELGPLYAWRVFFWMPCAGDPPFAQPSGEGIKTGCFGRVEIGPRLPVSECE